MPWDWVAVREWCCAVAGRSLSPADADDVAQEAVLRAWRHRDACRSPHAPWPWLRAIVHREVIRCVSRRLETVSEPLDPSADDPRLTTVVERGGIWPALRRLDPATRAIIVLHYYDDVSVADVAAMLGMPEGTVKVRLARTRAKLRESLSAE
jgi:RNA polymerase sigma-70 factor (ECF subfamily)